jgi:TupA-like ATPgrasp
LSWGLRGKAQRVLTSTVEAVLPEPAIIAIKTSGRYKTEFGVFPNLIRPKTFNEKVVHRMVFDRRPILARLQDKYAVRDYVREKIGDAVLPKLYWVTKNPADIPFDELPDKFVVKPTHGSHWVYLVADKTSMDRRDLVDTCISWLNQNYYYVFWEWTYKHIEPRIIVEQFVSDGRGLVPTDYKFYVFDGRVYMIQVDGERFADHWRARYGRSWNKLEVESRYKNFEGELPRPEHLDEMIEYAEILSGDLDFIRVDLYDTETQAYFGEITVYPAAGTESFYPRQFDRYLGGLWKLP